MRSLPSRRQGGRRLPPGQRTPEQDFYLPILAALEEMGGRGKAREVLDRVGQLMQHRLSDADRERLPSGRDIRWRNVAQWARYKMVQEGLLASDSPKGIWEITETGRAYLREHRAELD